jgi:hypothetical protein
MSNFTTYTAMFGSGKTGLATVGYQLRGAGGAAIGARVTAGVYEIGGGAYGVDIILPNDCKGIEWDTGEATPKFAFEDLRADFIQQLLHNKEHTDPGTGIRTVFQRDDTLPLVSGGIFEDVGGTPYSGSSTGIDRSDRMT